MRSRSLETVHRACCRCCLLQATLQGLTVVDLTPMLFRLKAVATSAILNFIHNDSNAAQVPRRLDQRLRNIAGSMAWTVGGPLPTGSDAAELHRPSELSSRSYSLRMPLRGPYAVPGERKLVGSPSLGEVGHSCSCRRPMASIREADWHC